MAVEIPTEIHPCKNMRCWEEHLDAAKSNIKMCGALSEIFVCADGVAVP